MYRTMCPCMYIPVQGKLIVRFDDTNPSKEKMEFEESMIKEPSQIGYQIKASVKCYSWGPFSYVPYMQL